MPPLLCPHLHGLVVGAACKVIININQRVSIRRITALLGVAVGH